MQTTAAMLSQSPRFILRHIILRHTTRATMMAVAKQLENQCINSVVRSTWAISSAGGAAMKQLQPMIWALHKQNVDKMDFDVPREACR